MKTLWFTHFGGVGSERKIYAAWCSPQLVFPTGRFIIKSSASIAFVPYGIDRKFCRSLSLQQVIIGREHGTKAVYNCFCKSHALSIIAKLTGNEFDAMVERGAFECIGPKKVELLHGALRFTTPAGPLHDDLIDYLTRI